MIYLVRHGESEWNLARLIQGQISYPRLTRLGRRQAHTAALAVDADAGFGVTSVVTSDLVRAVQTGMIVAGALGAALRVDRRWREQAFGQLEGLDYEASALALATAPDMIAIGGESDSEVAGRAVAALGDLNPSAATVVVTHGDTIRCLLTHLGIMVGCELVPNGAVIALDAFPGYPTCRLVDNTVVAVD